MGVSDFVMQKASNCKAIHLFSGKKHFFEVIDGTNKHDVTLEVSCDCKFFALHGCTKGLLCSHILAVINKINYSGVICPDKILPRSISEGSNLEKRRRECLRLVRDSNRKLNLLRFHSSESIEHINKKSEICKELEDSGKAFITEAIFKTGERADILVLDDFEIIEVVRSETEESLAKKNSLYPKGLKIRVIRC